MKTRLVMVAMTTLLAAACASTSAPGESADQHAADVCKFLGSAPPQDVDSTQCAASPGGQIAGSAASGDAGASGPSEANAVCPTSVSRLRSKLDVTCFGGSSDVAYKVISDEMVGLTVCGGRKVIISLPKGTSAATVAQALAEAYVDHVGGISGDDDPLDVGQDIPVGNGVVFAVHPGDSLDDGYTVGRLQYEATCAGATAPSIEIDIGSALSHKEYDLTQGFS